MLKYSYNNKLNILEIKATGTNRVTDIIKHYTYLAENNSFPKNLNFLIDSKDAKIEINPDELSQIFKPLLKTIKKYDVLYEAILVDKPYETAITTLFETQLKTFQNYKFNIFNTQEAALDWLSEN